MAFDRAHLATDMAALHEIILARAAAGEARKAELAAAKAGLLVQALEVEKPKPRIARLRRMQFGRSSEKIARTLEQFELKLEELEAEAPAPAASDDASAANGELSVAVEPSCQSERKKRNSPTSTASCRPTATPALERCTSPPTGGLRA
jgi:transposase